MDDILPDTFLDVCQIMLNIIGIILVVAYKLWWTMIATCVIGFILYSARKYYVKSSVAIKRIEGVSKSPILSHLGSSLNGLSTIRCFGVEEKLIYEFDHLQDLHTSAYYCYLATTRWFAVFCDWTVFFYLCLCTFPFIIASREDVVGADVGLVISTSFALTGMLQYGMRQTAELENLMTSVERVMEYGEIITEEESKTDQDNRISNHYQLRTETEKWPSNGVIEFRHVYLQYGKESRYVLEDINFKTVAGEKIGIVGRTGAGKSSLITALYRLVEPQGEIIIDDYSIKSKDLHILRSGISIIPQDPVLFSGTLRMNLDPFNSYHDKEIWVALALSNLDGYVSTLSKGLQHSITEGGDNISFGQRQLICLARALLRKTKILVLDEATANVDLETDAIIQSTIRKEFMECTVITIAHRLNTILDYDKVLVLRQGKVMEYDSPNNLMSNSTTLFYSMCKDAGLV